MFTNKQTFRSVRVVLAAGAIALAASAAQAQSGLNDLEVAHSAYTADVIDINYAKLALAKTQSLEVRHFAELMIRDHSAVNEGAGALLAKLGAKPQDNAFSKALSDGAAKETAKLSALSGKAFDRAYAQNELSYHETVNRIVGDIWIPAIQNAEVKEFLTQALVTFRAHEHHARHMVEALR
jgi:putative membrane protein